MHSVIAMSIVSGIVGLAAGVALGLAAGGVIHKRRMADVRTRIAWLRQEVVRRG